VEPPKPRRPGSSSEIQAAEVDRTVGGAQNQRRFDQPKRSMTSPGIAPPSPPIPPAPALPIEHARTVRAKSPLQRDTLERPAPPSTTSKARRSSPAGFDEQPTSIRVADGESAPSGAPATPLPPPSQHPKDARLAALEREAVRLRRQRDEARLAEQAALEAAASLPPAAEQKPETYRGVTLTQAKIGFVMAVTGILTIAAPFVAWKVSQLQNGAQRTENRATEAAAQSESAKTAARATDKEIAELKAQRQADMLWLIAVLRKQGIEARKPENWPDVPVLETEAPLRKPGKIDGGVVLIVKTPPATVKATP
jgi:hypothetical protein